MEYNKWIINFMNGWKAQDVDVVMQTIAKDCKYYETVFDEPCSDSSGIRKLWEVVPLNQREIEYQYKIISEDDKFCIINLSIQRTLVPSEVKEDIDAIFQISLDQDGLCTYFKQWRAVQT